MEENSPHPEKHLDQCKGKPTLRIGFGQFFPMNMIGYRDGDGDGDEMSSMDGFAVVLGHLGPTRTLGNTKLVDMKNPIFSIFS